MHNKAPTLSELFVRGLNITNFAMKEEENIESPPILGSRNRLEKQKQLQTKVAVGRRPKQAKWVLWIYPKLFDAFDQFKKTGVKFSFGLMIKLTMSILLYPTFL